MPFINTNSNFGDAVTGERIFPGERVFDTGCKNKHNTFLRRGKTRFVKEATIVWLAELAGYDVVKRNAGDSGDAESVDGEDVSVGGGEDSVGEAPVGGRKASSRRSNGASKGK